MSDVDDIQAAIARLAPADLARLKKWFDAFTAPPSEPPEERAARLGRMAGQAAAILRKGLARKP